MSDFNRNNDPAYRPVDPRINDPYAADPLARRPVIVEERGSGSGIAIGALLLAAIAFGGYYVYNHSDKVRTAVNDTVTASSTSPAPTLPAAVPAPNVSPTTRTPATPPASAPAQ